ncbi:MAG: hypothetical protein AAF862_03030 [Pseudomonadota bacterium]
MDGFLSDITIGVLRLPEWGLRIIITAAVLLLFSAIVWLFKSARLWYLKGKYPDFDASLSDAQADWVDVQIDMLAADKMQQRYPFWMHLLLDGALPGLILGGLSTASFYIALVVLQAEIPQDAFSGATIDFGVSTLFAFFLGLLLIGPVMSFWADRVPKLKDHLYFSSGWGKLNGQERDYADLEQELGDLLKTGAITHARSYSADQLTAILYRTVSLRLNPWIYGVLFFTLTSFILDVRYVWYVQPNALMYSPYFSLAKRAYTSADIRALDQTCRIWSDDGQPRVIFSISVTLSDGRKIAMSESDDRPGTFSTYGTTKYFQAALPQGDIAPLAVKVAPVLDLEPTQESCARILFKTRSDAEARKWAALFKLNASN